MNRVRHTIDVPVPLPSFLQWQAYICQKTFLFLHGISNERYANLVDHYKCQGLMRCHGLTGRSPANTTSPETIQDVLSFITNFTSAVHIYDKASN